MNIFENLENLQVSEECFDEIMGLVEELLSEDIVSTANRVASKDENNDLVQRARKAKEKGQEATAEKELKRIQNNKTRKDIHPSVVKRQQERDKAILDFSQRGGHYSDDDKGKAGAIAQARAEGRENKRTIGLDKTLNKQRPTYDTDYGETEVGGGDSPQTFVRSANKDNYPYGNSNVNAEDNIRNSNGTSLPDYQHKKKVAMKALKGHNKYGSIDSDKIHKKAEHLKQYNEKGYDNSDGYETKSYLLRNKGNNSKTSITTNPNALYRLGKTIENRKSKNK